jgi:hypothetical protein
MTRRTKPGALPPPSRWAADGSHRWHITAALDEDLLRRLEIYRISHNLNRSDAIRRLFNDHLPPTPHAD